MTSFVTKIAAATAIAFAGLGAVAATAPAQAASVDIVVKPRVVIKPAPRVVIKPAPRVVVVKPAPVIALAKATRHGLNKVVISNIGPNRVTVSGKIRSSWAKMSFANVRGCPAL